jgi:EAL domain-containing protein (putative c-di-GMP-specific phosphodiesterase class I)
MMSYDSIAKLSTTQIKRLNKLKEMGFNLAVTDIARNQIDIVKLTCIPFDFYILDPNFCRRLLNELMAQSQLTALIALCQNTKAKIIATGPNIISYQTSLKKLGVPLYLNQMDEELEELQSHSIRKDNVKSKLS